MTSRQVTTLPVVEYPVADGDWDTNRVYPIQGIVLHTEVGFKTSTEARFDDPNSHVSAHYGVNEDGTIDHYVDEDNVAYANGDYAVNQSWISIEHEDKGDYNGVRPDALYTTSAKLVNDICHFYSLPIDSSHIKPHKAFFNTGCPDALDINRIISMAKALDNTTTTSSPSVPQPTLEPTVAFTDQTKIPIGVDNHKYDWGIMEIQAIRSTLGDQRNQLISPKTTPKTPSSTTLPPTLYTFAPWVPEWLKTLLGG